MSKIYNLLYSLIRTELLFNTDKDIKYVKLEYTIEDIASMLGVFETNNIENELANENIIFIGEDNKIFIKDLNAFYDKYDKLRRGNKNNNLFTEDY